MMLSRSRFALHAMILFPLILLALAVAVTVAWTIVREHAWRAVREASGDAHASLIAHVHDRAHLLGRANSSSHNLANWPSRLNLSSFSAVETKVAPQLFFALSTLRWARMVAYVGKNGFSYCYYHHQKPNATFSVFSNVSEPNDFSRLYTTLVDSDTGDALGEAVELPPAGRNLQSQWIYEALGGRSGFYPSSHDREALFIFIAPVGDVGVVSFGITVKGFAEFVVAVDLRGGHQYLAMRDGNVLAQTGPPSNLYVLENDRVLIRGLNPDQSVAGEANISCGFDGILGLKSNDFTINGRIYKLSCVPLNSSGIEMVSVIALPSKEGRNFFTRMNTLLITLFSFLCFGTIFGSLMLVMLFKNSKMKEIYLRAMLIKQKEATQQAERKSMNKSLAFARASHDIRTSLAGITGLIDLCRSDVTPHCQLDKNLMHMNTCASKLLGILNSVLDISKVEAGKMKLEEVEFNMVRVIEESIDIFHVIALRKGVEVIWDPSDSSVLRSMTVKGDCRRFKQILDNLLSNAVKFTSRGHVVVRAWAKKPTLESNRATSKHGFQFSDLLTIVPSLFYKQEDRYKDMDALRRDQDAVEFVFEVDDTGIGISKDKRVSVFENYVQVKESSGTEHEGTGLGLGIVQSYVRLMGGEISIKDKEPGEGGTCFKFNIFLKSCSPAADSQGANLFDRSIKLEGVEVLLLIRGEETKKVAARWLENVGAKVWIANQSELLQQTLEKIRHKLIYGSGGSKKSEEVFEGSSNGEEQTLPLTTPKDVFRRSTSRTVLPASVLVALVDLSFGNVSEIFSSLSGFAKSVQNMQLKVAWLTNTDTPSADLKEIEKAQWDLVLQKPLHGSRLCAVLRLVQETRRTAQQQGQTVEAKIESSSSSKEVAAPAPPPPPPAVEQQHHKQPLSGMNVLLVEDTYVLRHLASTMLSRLGATVEVSENGQLALDLIREAMREASSTAHRFAYDVVLMDCEMPVMNGYEATREIRKEEKYYGYHVPIIALTAHTAPEEQKKTILCGMDLHLTKPLNPTKLLEAINSVCQK